MCCWQLIKIFSPCFFWNWGDIGQCLPICRVQHAINTAVRKTVHNTSSTNWKPCPPAVCSHCVKWKLDISSCQGRAPAHTALLMALAGAPKPCLLLPIKATSPLSFSPPGNCKASEIYILNKMLTGGWSGGNLLVWLHPSSGSWPLAHLSAPLSLLLHLLSSHSVQNTSLQ